MHAIAYAAEATYGVQLELDARAAERSGARFRWHRPATEMGGGSMAGCVLATLEIGALLSTRGKVMQRDDVEGDSPHCFASWWPRCVLPHLSRLEHVSVATT
eukprot:6252565-Prymnesium_polylepis.1